MNRIFGVLTIVSLLTACFDQPKANQPALEKALEKELTAVPVLAGLKQPSWLDALPVFARVYPAYAGDELSSDRQELLIYVATQNGGRPTDLGSPNSRNEYLSAMHQSLLNFFDRVWAEPESSDQFGQTISPRDLPVRFVQTRYSMADLQKYRGLIGYNYISTIGIDIQKNAVDVGVPSERDRQNLKTLMEAQKIPENAVVMTIRKVIPGFNPPRNPLSTPIK
jgi:hypothetical protein